MDQEPTHNIDEIHEIVTDSLDHGEPTEVHRNIGELPVRVLYDLAFCTHWDNLGNKPPDRYEVTSYGVRRNA